MTSMIARFKKPATPAAAPAPAPAPAPVAAVAPAIPPARVLAKDAPASDPAKAALPPKERKPPLIKDVSTPATEAQATLDEVNTAPVAEAAPEPKRGPGRPPKSTAAVLEFETMTMRHGLTVHLGDHNFAKVEMELTAKFQNKKLEDVEKELGDFCRDAVDRQLGAYADAKDEAAAPK